MAFAMVYVFQGSGDESQIEPEKRMVEDVSRANVLQIFQGNISDR